MDGTLGGRMVWVGMSRGQFVGGRNVKAPNWYTVKRAKYDILPKLEETLILRKIF